MNFDETLHYLLSLGHETLTMKLGLETTEKLLAALDSPHNAFAKVQIAGTNGKGSTAAMLDAIARRAGIKTGLYTSPHLQNITERICIAGHEISREDFARYATTVRATSEKLIESNRLPALPTFFEQVTLIALHAFREAAVQLAILETGLGGRLDATTAARANVIAITPVAFDHQEYLGETLAEIAAEKAAIIRPQLTRAAVIAPQLLEAEEVILQRCRECDVKPRYLDCDIEVIDADAQGRMRASFRTTQDNYENVRLALRGRHQLINASVVIRLAEALRAQEFSIMRADIIEGLENASYAGRLEWHETSPVVLFDGAHNAAGARVLRDYLDEFIKAPITLIFGAMRDKDLQEIASTLFPAARQIILTQPQNPRAATIEMLLEAVPPSFDARKLLLARSAPEAWEMALEVTPPGGIVCVSGSLYLVGEAQNLIFSSQSIQRNT
jgi:dihydrofolate synthase/folylpolyglutamate synthase